jgi:hypothetical protein
MIKSRRTALLMTGPKGVTFGPSSHDGACPKAKSPAGHDASGAMDTLLLDPYW